MSRWPRWTPRRRASASAAPSSCRRWTRRPAARARSCRARRTRRGRPIRSPPTRRTSGPSGSWTSGAASATRSRLRRRTSSRPPGRATRCSWRSPPRWRRPTSSCARSTGSWTSRAARWPRARRPTRFATGASRAASPPSSTCARRRRSSPTRARRCRTSWTRSPASRARSLSLTGTTPNALFGAGSPRGKAVDAIPVPPGVPEGLPSDLLNRRPDIQEAEQGLRAAQARVASAQAAWFPTISLTGAYGGESLAVGDLFKGPARAWTFAGALTLPLFNSGLTAAQVDLASSSERLAAAAYRDVVIRAFADARIALVAKKQAADRVAAREQAVTALRRQQRLATLRYDNGYSNYLDVLDAERTLFSAELALAEARRAHLVGGGGPLPRARRRLDNARAVVACSVSRADDGHDGRAHRHGFLPLPESRRFHRAHGSVHARPRAARRGGLRRRAGRRPRLAPLEAAPDHGSAQGARAPRGPVEPLPAPPGTGRGAFERRLRAARGAHRALAHRARGVQLQRAGHRQHGSAGALRLARRSRSGG